VSTLATLCTAVQILLLAVLGWNVFGARRLRPGDSPRGSPRVSVLIPARDEEANLRAHLAPLLASDWPHLEVLVCDDGSADGTAAVVRAAARVDGRVRLVTGTPPPPGWTGKNHACALLAREATGEILLFMDADVRVQPAAVGSTVAALEGADVVTALCGLDTERAAERAVIPLVAHLPALVALPLPLVTVLRAPSLAYGNGQWIAFRRDAYERCGGHAAVAGEVLEDVALARRSKRAGLRLLPVLATELLRVRMYRGWSEVRAGFRKNLYALAGGSALPFTLVAAATAVAWVLPWLLLPIAPALFALPASLLLLQRIVAARLAGHGGASVLLHPLGAILLLFLAAESAIGARRGGVEWKGRTLPHPTPGARRPSP
jgi:glycosyltransferase involved in cell wall biosynthesis